MEKWLKIGSLKENGQCGVHGQRALEPAIQVLDTAPEAVHRRAMETRERRRIATVNLVLYRLHHLAIYGILGKHGALAGTSYHFIHCTM